MLVHSQSFEAKEAKSIWFSVERAYSINSINPQERFYGDVCTDGKGQVS